MAIIQTTDARIWAAEFMKEHEDRQRNGDQRGEIDESLMVTWFANAIEYATWLYEPAGRDSTDHCGHDTRWRITAMDGSQVTIPHLLEVTEVPGRISRLHIDGEEFPYATKDGFHMQAKSHDRDEFPGVTLTILGERVRADMRRT